MDLAKLKAELVGLMEANLDTEDSTGGQLVGLSPERATAVAMVFVQREAQRAAQRSQGGVLLGVAAQLVAGSYANDDTGPLGNSTAISEAQSLINAVEEHCEGR